jgi:hypothetical protein
MLTEHDAVSVFAETPPKMLCNPTYPFVSNSQTTCSTNPAMFTLRTKVLFRPVVGRVYMECETPGFQPHLPL